ncbi:hypothetical protein BgiBS90_016366, partial [Biomphalaria glabrata]
MTSYGICGAEYQTLVYWNVAKSNTPIVATCPDSVQREDVLTSDGQSGETMR